MILYNVRYLGKDTVPVRPTSEGILGDAFVKLRTPWRSTRLDGSFRQRRLEGERQGGRVRGDVTSCHAQPQQIVSTLLTILHIHP